MSDPKRVPGSLIWGLQQDALTWRDRAMVKACYAGNLAAFLEDRARSRRQWTQQHPQEHVIEVGASKVALDPARAGGMSQAMEALLADRARQHAERVAEDARYAPVVRRRDADAELQRLVDRFGVAAVEGILRQPLPESMKQRKG